MRIGGAIRNLFKKEDKVLRECRYCDKPKDRDTMTYVTTAVTSTNIYFCNDKCHARWLLNLYDPVEKELKK